MRAAQAALEATAVGEDAGIEVWAHAERLDDNLDDNVDDQDEAGVRADEPVAIASLYKLPLALCWSDHAASGLQVPRSPLTLAAADRTPGPTGLSALADPVTLTQRDTVRLMLALSDNAAAEAVLDLVGLDRLNAWLMMHRLGDTRVRRGAGASWRLVAEQTGGGPAALAPARLADPDHDVTTSEYDPASASASTAREITRLLRIAWSTPHHAWVRESMALQAWRHRIGSGFPHDDVRVFGKTGTLTRLRHEAAVIEFPHEIPVAVTVLTRSTRPEIHQPRVDTAIGSIARTLVHAMRRPR
ncbi:MAG: serine hydrolase [Ornithinimicrobium sp.]